MDLTGMWICNWCESQQWTDSEDPPDGWMSQRFWPKGDRLDLCTSCVDEIEAASALFTHLKNKRGWSDEHVKAAAQAIISDEQQKYSDFMNTLEDEPPEWEQRS